MAINVSSKTYSVTVTPSGGKPVVLAQNYAFRTEQAGATSLGYLSKYSELGEYRRHEHRDLHRSSEYAGCEFRRRPLPSPTPSHTPAPAPSPTPAAQVQTPTPTPTPKPTPTPIPTSTPVAGNCLKGTAPPDGCSAAPAGKPQLPFHS